MSTKFNEVFAIIPHVMADRLVKRAGFGTFRGAAKVSSEASMGLGLLAEKAAIVH